MLLEGPNPNSSNFKCKEANENWQCFSSPFNFTVKKKKILSSLTLLNYPSLQQSIYK